MKILIADDHQMMRDGLRAVLAREQDLEVVGEAADGRAVLELCPTLQPDVVIMDISMPGLNGIEATRQLGVVWPRARVVALSMNSDSHYAQAMFEAGAWGYLVKSSASGDLVRALRAVARDEKYVGQGVVGSVIEAFVSGPPKSIRGSRHQLSPREREVLQLLAEGLTSKRIAGRLDVAVCTVETHRKQVMAKLELRSVAQLTKFAIRSGLTTVE